jgi:hypothetical protein
MGRGGTDSEERRQRQAPRRRHRWTDERVVRELREFVAGRDTFPSRPQFEAAGRGDLWNAIRRHGGSALWAPRVGLSLREAQHRQALSAEEAVSQAKTVIAEDGYLPGSTKLRALGYPKLATYIYFAGGAKRFCFRHGLHSLNP